MTDWADGYHQGYTHGIGACIGFLEHVSGLCASDTADWTASLAHALRRAAANITPYCVRCGIPHTTPCLRPEDR